MDVLFSVFAFCHWSGEKMDESFSADNSVFLLPLAAELADTPSDPSSSQIDWKIYDCRAVRSDHFYIHSSHDGQPGFIPNRLSTSESWSSLALSFVLSLFSSHTYTHTHTHCIPSLLRRNTEMQGGSVPRSVKANSLVQFANNTRLWTARGIMSK